MLPIIQDIKKQLLQKRTTIQIKDKQTEYYSKVKINKKANLDSISLKFNNIYLKKRKITLGKTHIKKWFIFILNFWAEFSPFIEKKWFLLSGQGGYPSLHP